MLTLADQTLWLLTTLVEAFVVYLFLVQGLFRKFLFLNLYFVLSVCINIGRYSVLLQFGFTSPEYGYFYYYSDVLLTLSLFVCVVELTQRVVGARVPCRKVVVWSASAFLATGWFSFPIASLSSYRAAAHFLFEFTQNIYFACCLAVVLLGIWKLRNDSEDRIAARLVNVLAMYFLSFVVIYGARQWFPDTSGLSNVYPMMGAWLPLGCGFALVTQQ